MSNLGGECQIVDDRADFGRHIRVVLQIEDLELLGSHEPIRNLLDSRIR